MNTYCLYKGKLLFGAPFKPAYAGSPHYILLVDGGNGGDPFKIVVNAASTQVGEDGNNNVYFYADLHFEDAVTGKLDALPSGLQAPGFPRLDYYQDHSLLDLRRMRPIPYQDESGNRVDVNDDISTILTIDTSTQPERMQYDNGSGYPQPRDFFKPQDANVIVYSFGFLFPAKDGLHETHMNQGNPKGPHWKENGAFQDGGLIIQRTGSFAAIFTAFQTQYLPTDAKGFPSTGAIPLPEFIKS